MVGSAIARELGFTAKMALHPVQVPAILDVFSPTVEEVERVPHSKTEVLAALERKLLRLSTWTIHNAKRLRGAMDDVPRLDTQAVRGTNRSRQTRPWTEPCRGVYSHPIHPP